MQRNIGDSVGLFTVTRIAYTSNIACRPIGLYYLSKHSVNVCLSDAPPAVCTRENLALFLSVSASQILWKCIVYCDKTTEVRITQFSLKNRCIMP